jgi:hypothetical protein
VLLRGIIQVFMYMLHVTVQHPSHVYSRTSATAECFVPASTCRRLLQNPAYYELEDATPEGVSAFLSQLVETALADLADAGCVTVRAAHHCVAALAPGAGSIQPSQLLCSWVDATHTVGSCSLQS